MSKKTESSDTLPLPQRFSQKEVLICRECKNPDGSFFEDNSTGDTICEHCGTVLNDRLIDYGTEWRTFADDAGTGGDPNRVARSNQLNLDDGGLSTTLAFHSDRDPIDGLARHIGAGIKQTTNRDRFILRASREIHHIADRIDMPRAIRERALELFNATETCKSVRGRSFEGMLASSLYIACRQEGVARSFREICTLANISKKELARCFKFQVKTLGLEKLAVITTTDFMSRFCSILKLSSEIAKAAEYVAKEANNLHLAGKCPISVAAASIYMVTQLSDTPCDQKSISDVSGVSEITIRNCFAAMYQYRRQLLPPFFEGTKVDL